MNSSNINPNANFGEVARVYEDKIKNIMVQFNKLDEVEADKLPAVKKMIEDECFELEKIMDKTSMERVISSHKINMALIQNLRQHGYDFPQDERRQLSYNSFITQAMEGIDRLNSNL